MFTRILVPTDFSELSDVALDYARALAETFAASLHVLHVLDPPCAGAIGEEGSIAESRAVQARLFEEASHRLQRRVMRVARTRYRVRGDIVTGPGADSIVNYARGRDIELIVMGTHGRSGLAHVLIGSVAERVVRTAPCPVLTIRCPARSGAAGMAA